MPNRQHVPAGFRFAGIHSGLKIRRRDLGVLLTELPAEAAAVVTSSRARAACADRTAEMLPKGGVRAVVVVSGNANALTGARGAAHDLRLAERTAEVLGISAEEVVTACTGVIGVPLPVSVIEAGLKDVPEALDVDPEPFARAIATTDTTVKLSSRAIALGGRNVRILGVAKGSGMIHPGLATMLCFLCTDLALDAERLQEVLGRAVQHTFNRISVDTEMSTNDMVLLVANGAAGVGPGPEQAVPEAFEAAVESICRDLAIAIARDGEGATRLLTSVVRGAPSEEAAADLARSVTESALFKAALFAGDPNWGRALAALGARAVRFPEVPDPREARMLLQGLCVYDGGPVADLDRARLRHLMQSGEILVEVVLPGGGSAEATSWGCDLSYDYVRINADIAATIAESEDGTIRRSNELRRLSPRMRHDLLIDGLEHIRRFKGMIAVVRVGGEAAVQGRLREALLRDLLLLRSAGLRPILVHGGGQDVPRGVGSLGEPLQLKDGAPDTCGEATDTLEAVLVGRVNQRLVALATSLGGRAVGLSGKDGGLLRARRVDPADGDHAAGVVEDVDPSLLLTLDEAGYLPVIAPLGVGRDGETVTLAADQVAARLAVALKAGKLIFLGDAPGLMEGSTLLTSLKAVEAQRLLDASALGQGQSLRVEAALHALRGGVPRVHLVDGRVPHHLVGELFTTQGVGTMIRSH